jgi:hypothetical protein
MRFFTFYEIALNHAAIGRNPCRIRNQLNGREITVAVVVDAHFVDHLAGLVIPRDFCAVPN